VQELVSNPSSNAINARDAKTGDSALHILVQERNLEWLAFLLSRGARPDTQNNEGNSPLGLAAQLGWVEGATQLLARARPGRFPNNRGETPLILVVQSRQLPIADRVAMIELLIGQGADPSRQDSFAGYSALDYARQESRTPEILARWRASREGQARRRPSARTPRAASGGQLNSARPGSMSPASRRAARRAKRKVSALRRAGASLRSGASRRISAS
jgi:ankyrin repeat protein